MVPVSDTFRRRLDTWIFPLLVAALALIPRLLPVGRYITPDELVWVYRSIQFREALIARQWAGTLVAGHPGVITAWLGTLATSLELVLDSASRDDYAWLTRMAYLTPDNVEAFQRLAGFLTPDRVAVALVNCLGIAAVYALARKLWGTTAAALITLFLALDPFVAGLSGIMHVDGLSATFAILSLLALVLGLQGDRHRFTWLAGSGALAALAALSKTPTLLLLPVTAIVLFSRLFDGQGERPSQRIASVVLGGLAWGVAFLTVVLLLYPALWVAPVEVLATVTGSANRHIDEALRPTFFLGETVFDPGPAFYPVVLVWRLSPVVWLALVPLAWQFLKRINAASRSSARLPWLVLLIWAGLFLVAITPAAKKFDRYLLPTLFAVVVLAGIVWAGWSKNAGGRGRWVLPALVAAQAVYWLAFAAFPLAAYNPLAGGPWTAVRVLPVGWGEAISESGTWLSSTARGDGGDTALAGIVPSFAPFYTGVTLVPGLDDPRTAVYIVQSLSGRQLGATDGESGGSPGELIHMIRFGGLEQGWVYEQGPIATPDVSEMTGPLTFDGRVGLVSAAAGSGDDLVPVEMVWERLTPMEDSDRFTVRLAVTDAAGNVWASLETDLLNGAYFYPADWEFGPERPSRYQLELPPAIPPGEYQVEVSLIDQATGGQLAATDAGGAFAGVVVPVAALHVEAPSSPIDAGRLQIPVAAMINWDDLTLLGHSAPPAELLAGSMLPVDLFWQRTDGTVPGNLTVRWSLRDTDSDETAHLTTIPLSRHDTAYWRPGETVHEKYLIPLPPMLPAGRYALVLQPLTMDGLPLGEHVELGETGITNIERDFAPPGNIATVMNACLGEMICLRGADQDLVTLSPGQTAELTLFWQATAEPDQVYTAFVHLLNPAGETVLAADHWPGGLPSDIWATRQVITDRFTFMVPTDLPPGDYSLRVGLYSAVDGQRLPVTSVGSAADGVAGDDHVILPLPVLIDAP